jgi:hypothetical protein
MLTFKARSGRTTVSFDGRITKNNKLKPGTYTVTISATANGKRAKTHALTFTIAKS